MFFTLKVNQKLLKLFMIILSITHYCFFIKALILYHALLDTQLLYSYKKKGFCSYPDTFTLSLA